MMKVKKYKLGGAQFVSLVNEDDCPYDPYVSCYLRQRLASRAFNTALRSANELLFLFAYFDSRSINLTARISSGELISIPELTGFLEHSLNTRSKSDEDVIQFSSVKSKAFRNALAANRRLGKKVAGPTASGRLRQLRFYIEWLFDQFHGGRKFEEALLKRFKTLLNKIKLYENSLGRRHPKTRQDFENAIPKEILERLISIVLPESENNPFRMCRLRNYLIVHVLLQTGIRRGALAKLKISDCDFFAGRNLLRIYRSSTDGADPRNDRPNQKSGNHIVEISSGLAKRLKYYIDQVREKYDGSKNHDFIFIAECNTSWSAGAPISVKQINNLFCTLSKSLCFRVHPHLLRHYWNDELSALGEKNKIETAKLEELRRQGMGWSANSDMSRIYNDRHMQREVNQLMLERQLEALSGNGDEF